MKNKFKQPLEDLRNSITSDFASPLSKVGNIILESIDVANFIKQSKDYKVSLSQCSTNAVSFEQSMKTVRNAGGIKPECVEKIAEQQDLFVTEGRIRQIYNLFTALGDKISAIPRQLENDRIIDDYQYRAQIPTQKFSPVVKYFEANFESLLSRLNSADESIRTSEDDDDDSEDAYWVLNLFTFFRVAAYITIGSHVFFIGVFILFQCYHRTPGFVLLTKHVITVIIVVVPAALFVGQSFSGAIPSHVTCLMKPRHVFLSNYTIEMIDSNLVMVEKSFSSTCKSPNNTFFSDLEMRKVFSTDKVIQFLGFEDYKQQLVNSIYNDKLQLVTIPEQFKEEVGNISKLVETLDELIKMECIVAEEKKNINSRTKEYRTLVENSPKYEKLVEDFDKGITNSKELALNIFDESFKQVRSKFDNLLKNIIPRIESLDFSCQQFVESDDTCSWQGDLDHVGFFFCLLFGLGLIEVCFDFFYVPPSTYEIKENITPATPSTSNDNTNGRNTSSGTGTPNTSHGSSHPLATPNTDTSGASETNRQSRTPNTPTVLSVNKKDEERGSTSRTSNQSPRN